MKKKNKSEYLPLYWCKKMRGQVETSIGKGVTSEELFEFTSVINRSSLTKDGGEALQCMMNFSNKYPAFGNLLDQIAALPEKEQSVKIWLETVGDLESMANVLAWSENKQVFKFDEDFIDELIKTENLSIVNQLDKWIKTW